MTPRSTSVVASRRSVLSGLSGLSLALLVCAAGCGGGDEAEQVAPPTGAEALAALRAHVTELKARPEKQVETIEVQHLLIGFAGTGTKATRSKEEAEQFTADLFARIAAGEDFGELVAEHTDDTSPTGFYSMTIGAPQPDVMARGQMVGAFGDVGWRLDVGEYGVAEYAPRVSPYGWHIIKRTR